MVYTDPTTPHRITDVSNSIKHMDLTPWNAKMKEPGMTAFFHQMRKFRTGQAKEQVINLSNKKGQTKGNYHF